MIETAPFGRTGHESTRVLFGAAALGAMNQDKADGVLELLLEFGVNHIDTAEGYGDSELRIGPWMETHRDRFFLATKTRERSGDGARANLEASLERLRTDRLDLYQCHALSSSVELEQVLGPRGAIAAFEEARDAGRVRFLGITGHHCGVLREALERYPFDSVMFPLNPLQAADPDPALDYRPLLETAERRGVGAIGIKAIARGPWADGVWREYSTWYEPHTDPATIRERVRYALSHPIATSVLPSDVRLWPAIFDAAEHFEALPLPERDALVEAERGRDPLYVVSMQPARQAFGPARAGSGA